MLVDDSTDADRALRRRQDAGLVAPRLLGVAQGACPRLALVRALAVHQHQRVVPRDAVLLVRLVADHAAHLLVAAREEPLAYAPDVHLRRAAEEPDEPVCLP